VAGEGGGPPDRQRGGARAVQRRFNDPQRVRADAQDRSLGAGRRGLVLVRGVRHDDGREADDRRDGGARVRGLSLARGGLRALAGHAAAGSAAAAVSAHGRPRSLARRRHNN